MAIEYGFVYCVGNRVMPNIYKVGMTMNAPRLRCDQLSSGTAIPVPFDIMFYIETDDAKMVEAAIHRSLVDFRVSDNREFFACDIREIYELFKLFKDDCSPMAMTREGDYEISAAPEKVESVSKTYREFGIINPVVKPISCSSEDEPEEVW